MKIETYSIGDTVLAEKYLGTKFKIASVLQGQLMGYFHLDYQNGSPVVDQNGERKRFHRSLLTKAAEEIPPRGHH